MGMFDEITCEYPLPESGYRVPFGHAGFQTKDLECLMDRYTISVEGRLIRHDVRYEWREGDEGDVFGGYLEPVSETLEDTGYHGDLRFYDAFSVVGGGRVWIEFAARFTEGAVSRVEVAEIRELPQTRSVRLGEREYRASDSDLGIEIIHLGDEEEIERAGE